MNFWWLRNTCHEVPANFTLDISKKKGDIFFLKNLLNNIDWLAVMLFEMNPCTLVPCAMSWFNWILDMMVCKALTSTYSDVFPKLHTFKIQWNLLVWKAFLLRSTEDAYYLSPAGDIGVPRVLLWMPSDCTILDQLAHLASISCVQ